MTVLEYERRFQDLSLFAPQYILTEEHMIEKLRDGLRQELRQRLIILWFKTVRELIKVAQTLEAYRRRSARASRYMQKKKMGIIPVVDHHF